MGIAGDYDNMSLADLLAYKVSQNGSRTFAVDRQGRWTWSDIDRGSCVIAADLIRMGVRKGSHVALCGTNSINWIAAFFAIQRLGGLAELINPTMLAADIGKVAATGDASYIICGKMTEQRDRDAFGQELSRASGISPEHIYYMEDVDLRDRTVEYDTTGDAVVEPDDVAIMIFTSGTTGSAKGVLHSAQNLLSAAWINRIDQKLSRDDRTCLILPLFHIFGLLAGLLANAVADATLYIPADIHVSTIIELIDREKITVFHSVPTMLIAIMSNRDFLPEKLKTLRCTIISGAATTKAHMTKFQEELPNDTFLSSYGLSEMAPVTISSFNDDIDLVRTTVGRPVRDIYIRIWDPQTGKECPDGQSGEILVKGHRLMTAYYKVPVSDQPLDGEGWLHTGDLGYRTKDGYICLSGRIKELIIRGGENIMPSMVENAISSCQGIENVKVLGVPSDFYGEEVAACIKPSNKETFDVEALKKELSGKLARYMMPSFIEIYDEFPLLASGKMDMRRLKADVNDRIAGRAGVQNT